MARSAGSIQAEIDRLETFLSGSGTTIASAASDGTSVQNIDREKAAQRLDSLYLQLGRANGTAPMLCRGRLRGLR
jgi:hypothetical protein